MTELLHQTIDIFLHLDTHLNEWSERLGPWLYVVLGLIVFCETGLVVTPFLPGDSLIFAVGALAATDGSPIDVFLVGLVLIVAAVIGDAVNYSIGHWVGPRVFTRESSWFLKKEHLVRTQRFYEKHGGKTIIIARFVPIVRTFAPFVAGIGRMSYPRFAVFNVAGGVAWVVIFLVLGVLFGNLPIVKKYFQLVVIGIILVSCLPIAFEWWKARREAKMLGATKESEKPPVAQA